MQEVSLSHSASGSSHSGLDSTSKSSVLSTETIGKVVYALGFILKVYGAPRQVRVSFYRQAMGYLSGLEEPRYESRVKYLVTYPLNVYLKQSSPVAIEPCDQFVPIGPFRRWFASRLRVFSRRNTALFFSWFQGKRGAAPLSDESINAKMAKHRQQMGKPDPADGRLVNEVIRPSRSTLVAIGNAFVKEYNTSVALSQSDGTCRDQHAASQSACYENSRTRGGAMGYLRTIAGVGKPRTASWTYAGQSEVEHNLFSGAIDLFTDVDHFGKWELEYDGQLSIRNPEMERHWTSSIEREAAELSLGPYGAKIAGVLEPLKLRVISKGPASAYYVLWRFQICLWRVLKRMPCFRLIGERMDSTFLVDLVRHASHCGEGKLVWFSWDYQGATDGSSALLGRTIIEGLVKRLPLWEQDVIIKGLAPHHILYPRDTGLEPIQQQNGQLMGSPASFGILCLINLCIYMRALEVSGDVRPDEEKLLGVLINGDDKLRVARESQWAIESAVGSSVGMLESVGKAYAHPVFANINSKCYHYTIEEAWCPIGGTWFSFGGATPWRVMHFNVGLFLGKGKVQRNSEGSEERTIVSTIDELMDGTPANRQCDILKDFIHRHRTLIGAETQGRNLFVHESLGGMGCTPPRNFRYTISGLQRRLIEAATRDGDQEELGGVNSAPLYRAPLRLIRGPWLSPERESVRRHFRGRLAQAIRVNPQLGVGRLATWARDYVEMRRSYEVDVLDARGDAIFMDKMYSLSQPWAAGVSYLTRVFGRVGLV